MDIQVTEIEPCKLSIKYTADAGQILEKRGVILQAFKKAPAPGFRPGKASTDAIKVHYRDQIEDALKRALAEDAYHDTLFERKIRPHGPPKFNSLLMLDSTFVCEFEMYSKPDFELSPYKELEIPKPHEEKTVTEIAAQIMQELRLKTGEATPYSEGDFVQDGDTVIIDYECFLEGTKIDNLSAEGEMLVVGKSMLAGFDEQLVGMLLGETREFDLLIPENGMPSLVGKIVHFKITLNMGSKTEPTPLNDILAQRMGKNSFGEVEEFVNSAAMGKSANMIRLALNEAVASRLVADNQFSVPNWMSISEAKYLAHGSKLEWDPLPDVDKERFLILAEKNVKLALILDKVRETELEAQLTDQEVFDIIKQNLARTQNVSSVDDTMREMNKTGYLQILFSRIKDEYSLDFVTKNMKVID